MAFEGFRTDRINDLHVRHGGSGPPLLLLHGYPETGLIWAGVAAALAGEFTLVVPDLPGYGASGAPPTVPDHATYSKRAFGTAVLAVMAELGFGAFDVAGHDRGGRVGYRLALDHPEAVRRLTVLDIVPTGEVWARADDRFALGYWHWPVLAQPEPLAETIISADPGWFFFDAQFGGLMRGFAGVGEYERAVADPSVVHAICEDYRAGAGIDRAHDDADRAAGRRITAPVQVLWGARGAVGAWYDPLEVWRGWTTDVTGNPLDCGHFLPEERPAETAAALSRFHGLLD